MKITLKPKNGGNPIIANFDSEVMLLFMQYFGQPNREVSIEQIQKFLRAVRSKVNPPSAVNDPTIMLALFNAFGQALDKITKEAEKIEVIVE